MDTQGLEKPTRRQDILYRKLDDEGILYDSQTSTVHVLNPTSELIWNCFDGEHGIDQITDEILKRYRVDRKQAEHDVVETLRQFTELRLLEGMSDGA